MLELDHFHREKNPLGAVLGRWTRPNGLEISRVRVPLGVIGIIYESRPNVTADAAGLCLKAGNAAILRGGSESFHSSRAVLACLAAGLEGAGLPPAAIQAPPTASRDAVGMMLTMSQHIDVIVPREILRQKERTQRIFNVVTGAVAAIGLLVGGIGIMNIMLASVAERTREVGIRRALGATRADVAAQFLSESSLLTAVGGLAGVLAGVAGSVAIQRWAGWPTALSPPMLVLSVLMALLVGIGFGFYPAWRAAHLEPMEALRN